MESELSHPKWTFMTNHTHILVCLQKDASLRARDIAVMVGITERSVQRILSDLEEYGVIARHKDGRRNTYQINYDKSLRHTLEKHRTVGDVLQLFNNDSK